MKRKIADCINIRVRTGDFQHIEVVKYAEEEIEYSNDQERIEKEDALTETLVSSVMRSLRSIPDKIGRGKSEVILVEQAIAKAIPAWLANEPIPNIANNAKKNFNTQVDRLKAQKDKEEAIDRDMLGGDGKLIKEVKPEVKPEVGDLFEEDAPAKIIIEPTASEKKSDKVEDFDLFSDSDDLFDNK